MGRDGNEDRSALFERTREFVTALKATPSVQRFIMAQRRFQTDPGIRQILEALRVHGEAFRKAQEIGTLTQEQIRALRHAQAQYREHPATQELELARTGMVTLLKEVNAAMGNILGLDIGRIVGPAGGRCCS